MSSHEGIFKRLAFPSRPGADRVSVLGPESMMASSGFDEEGMFPTSWLSIPDASWSFFTETKRGAGVIGC